MRDRLKSYQEGKVVVYFLCGIEVVFCDMFFVMPHVCEDTLNAKVFGSLTGGDTGGWLL